jgi:ankyrin repeat protein
MARQLISCGANVTRKDSTGKTPLGCACASAKTNHELVELLLTHGASAQEVDAHGVSLLWSTLSSPNYQFATIKTLIEHGARTDLMTGGRRAPIHLVILSGNTA